MKIVGEWFDVRVPEWSLRPSRGPKLELASIHQITPPSPGTMNLRSSQRSTTGHLDPESGPPSRGSRGQLLVAVGSVIRPTLSR